MIHQAGTLATRDGAGNIFPAMAHGKRIADQVQAIPKRNSGKIRPKIARSVIFHPAHNLKTWEILFFVQPHIRKMFIVLQQDVVARLKRFCEARFQRERFHFVLAKNVLKIRDV